MAHSSLADRVADLEAVVRQLREETRRSGDSDARHEAPIPVRIAKTVNPAVDPYPVDGSGATCFPIVFQDGTYTRTAGINSPTWTARQSASRDVALNIVAGEYIPVDTVILIWWKNNRWWTSFSASGNSAKVGKAAAGIPAAAGDTPGSATVALWTFGGGTFAVSGGGETFTGYNISSTAVAAATLTVFVKTVDGIYVAVVGGGGSDILYKGTTTAVCNVASASVSVNALVSYTATAPPAGTITANNILGLAGPSGSTCVVIKKSDGTYDLLGIKHTAMAKVTDVLMVGNYLKETKQNVAGMADSADATSTIIQGEVCP